MLVIGVQILERVGPIASISIADIGALGHHLSKRASGTLYDEQGPYCASICNESRNQALPPVGIKPAENASHPTSDRVIPMIDRFRDRACWIEQNIMPHEFQIRAWLKRNRIQNLEVDDIIQEMYTRIASQSSFDEIRVPIRYAMQVAYSIMASHLRRMKVVTITAGGDLEDLGIPSPEASPEEELAQRDDLREVADALETLPERTREILLLRRVEGLTLRETAERLAISEKTIEKHMARATLFLMHRFGRGAKSAHHTSYILTEPAGENDETCD